MDARRLRLASRPILLACARPPLFLRRKSSLARQDKPSISHHLWLVGATIQVNTRKPKSWIKRQQRRMRLSIIQLGRRERASDLRIQADPLPEAGDRERETSAFWFRRVTTTVLLGNGAGVIALGSYIANGNDNADISRLAYPAMSSFLSGALLGFTCYIISYASTSMRFEAYMTIIERAAKIAKNSGKKTVTTQHDGVFYFLIILVCMQIACLIGSGVSFYKGSVYVLSYLGKSACSQKVEDYCYGSPLLFPFVDPYDPRLPTEDKSAKLPEKSDFTIQSFSEGVGKETEIARISVSSPQNFIVKDLVSRTTIQITSKYGRSCLFETSWFSSGGSILLKPKDSILLGQHLNEIDYHITPAYVRIYAEYTSLNGENNTESFDVDLTSGEAKVISAAKMPPISLLHFHIGEYIGVASESKLLSDEEDIRCLKLASDAGFALTENGERLVETLARSTRAKAP